MILEPRRRSRRACTPVPGERELTDNGRRWHDDPSDYEDDHEKWSIPGRLGYRLVFATYDKVTQHPDQLLRELTATLAA